MTTVLKPTALLHRGLQVQQINNLASFKSTDELGERMQTLLDKNKADDLSPEEALELEAIGELDEIFSYINAVLPGVRLNLAFLGAMVPLKVLLKCQEKFRFIKFD